MTGTTFASLLGGIGLFLLGMRMMTDGLKLAAGNALRSILHTWTSTNLRGLLAGILITAIVQSSSAVTVATVGFVNAGLLTLAQAVWVVFGTNVGTTMTGWLVALVGVKVDVGAFALPLLGAGMLLRLAAGANVRRSGIGEAAAGFGAFFLGVGILQSAFADLAPLIGAWPLESFGPGAILAFVAIGIVLTLLTQSSSAAIAIALTASAGGAVPFELAAGAVIGTNVGTTSTALFASIGATAPAKRVASAHIAFNLLTGAVALVLLPLLLRASAAIGAVVGPANESVTALAVFHTLFNVVGVLLMWPTASALVRFLSQRFVSVEEKIGRPAHLDSTVAKVPAFALRGLVLELTRMAGIAFDLAARCVRHTVHAPDARNAQEGIERLGQAVRAFVGEISAGPLPDDVVAALPDLLRASQHLEELAEESAHLGRLRQLAPMSPSARAERPAADWEALIEAVLASLADVAGPTRAAGAAEAAAAARAPAVEAQPLDDIAACGARVANAYEALKAELLRAGARGRLRVDAMEEELLQARRLRRIADAALKARRRLEPWIERVGEIATAAVPSAPSNAEDPASADTAGKTALVS